MIFQVVAFLFVDAVFHDANILQLFDLVVYLLFLKRFDVAKTESNGIVDTFRRTAILKVELPLQSSSNFIILLCIIPFWEVLRSFGENFIIILIFRYYGVCESIAFYEFKAAD